MSEQRHRQWPADHVERRPISTLIHYARNTRTHTDAQIAQIAASMREWGWTIPLLISTEGTIIAGHGRVLAAQRLGWNEAPVMIAHGWTAAQVRAYRVADNRLAELSGWDTDLLAGELDDLRDREFDLTLIGFDTGDLNDMIGTPNVGPDDDDRDDEAKANAIPEQSDLAVTARGDIWTLGDHRVMCGDCRDLEQVQRLIESAAINLAFTSPPYAEQREYDTASGFRPIEPDAYVEWFAPVASNVSQIIASDGSWFVNIKPCCEGLDTSLYVFDLVIAHVRQWGWHFATEFCWERPGVPKGVTQRFKNAFEPIYQFAKGRWKLRPEAVRHESANVPSYAEPPSWGIGAARRRYNGTKQTMSDVQGVNAGPGEFIGPGLAYPSNRLPTFSGSHQALGHAAAFPVGLPQWFIEAFTDESDRVFDPFLGSGSTIMAAERTNRVGYGMELSPAYCDIAIRRWQEYTGRSAILDGTGHTFEEIGTAKRKQTLDGVNGRLNHTP